MQLPLSQSLGLGFRAQDPVWFLTSNPTKQLRTSGLQLRVWGSRLSWLHVGAILNMII